MQDDSPWKPPSGNDDVRAPSEESSTPPPPPPPASEPVLPDHAAPVLPPPGSSSPTDVDQPRLPASAASAADRPAPTLPATTVPAVTTVFDRPAPAAAPVDPVGAVTSPPVAEPVPTADPPRSKWLVVGAFVAVVAVVAAGVFAIVNLTGNTTEGGSNTPEELGTELLAAIENEDVLGAIELLLPGERRSLGEPFVELVDELQRLDVLAETDLSQLAGLDVELTGETVTARQTNVVDIINLDLGADVVVTIDGGELPIGSLITDNLPPEIVTELRGSQTTETDRIDLSVTAVEEGGRWYVSLLHTVAEVARGELEPDIGIPTEGIGAVGADAPEGAVDLLLTHVENLDLRGMLQVLNPDEAAALQRYSPLFLDDAEALLAEVPLTWQIVDRSIRVEGSGDERTAFVDAIAIEGIVEGTAFEVSFSDGCIRAAAEGESFEQCLSEAEGGVAALEEIFSDAPEVLELVDTLQEAFADIEPSGLELRRHAGQWYVSPIESFTELGLNVLRALDRDEMEAIASAIEPAVNSLPDAVPGVLDELAGDELDTVVFGDDREGTGTDESATIDDLAGDVTIDDGGQFDDDPAWVDCFDEVEASAAIGCFDRFVESGEIAPEAVPAVLRFPECGYAELWWSGEVYGLPDGAFIDAVTPAGECFQALVEQGVVSAQELPNELVHLDCFEGRNWYQVFDDPDYDERYYACIDQHLDD
jgi:hypothetical protein